MFKTFVGPVEDEASVTYLRPETAQGIFVNFANVQKMMRRKIPFGIAQIGKSFRNEITPGNFTFRTREFEQMEIEFFVKPGTDEEWYERWVDERFRWYLDLGISRDHLRLRKHEPHELAHYAKACVDVEYLFPMGWSELEGIANRGDFDLRKHSEYSKKDLSYFDETTKEKYIPCVIEPSAGADRATLSFLIDAYREEEVRGEKRTVLALQNRLAPIKIAVLPLLKNRSDIVEMAKALADDLRSEGKTVYDDTASIGRLYRRQDEIGTPYCVTIDVQSLDDHQVTVRERDSMRQVRVSRGGVKAYLKDCLAKGGLVA
jgi:glycyl-tRNA synthetase